MKEKLKCEIKGCPNEFYSSASRPFNHCEDCAGKLRKQKLGPVQLLRRPEVAQIVRSIIQREFRR